MKRFINSITATFGISLLLFFSSCLKNSQYYTDLSNVAASIDMPLAALYSNQPFTLAFQAADTPAHFYVYVNVASPVKLGKSVNATLGLDSAYLNQYNAQQDAATKQAQADYLKDTTHSVNDSSYPPDYVPYELLPDTSYTVSGLNLTVPAHQRLAYATAAIFTNKIDATHKYVLPFTIVKADLPIENWNHLLISLAIKNKYDGTYHYSGVFHHPTAGDRNMDGEKDLATVNANTVSTTVGDLGGYTLLLTVNPDNTVTVGGSVGSSIVKPISGASNTYDPGTRTFTLHYYYNDAAPRKIDETIVYEHPRG